jgi:hypothetical protein
MDISHQSKMESNLVAVNGNDYSSQSSLAWSRQATTCTFIVVLLLSFAIGLVTVFVAALL